MQGHEQQLAIFRCVQPGHQHTYTIQPGRRSIGTLSSSDVRLQDVSRQTSFAAIEFGGGDLLWISRLSESDSVKVMSSLTGPDSDLPHDDKFYQILAGNIINVEDCRFQIDFHKANSKIESTQILESLQEQCLSDTDAVLQSSTDPIEILSPILAPLRPSETPPARLPSGVEVVSQTDSIPSKMDTLSKTPARAGFLSPSNRPLPVVSTPMKDEQEATFSTIPERAIPDAAVSSPRNELNVTSPSLHQKASAVKASDVMITSPIPKRSATDVLPLRQQQDLLTSPVPKRSASNIAASLSSPPIRRRSSISGNQEEEEPVSPPLGYSGEQCEEITSPEPLPGPAPQPSTTSILHSATIPVSTPSSSRNRISATSGTELSTNRKRRRVGLVAPKQMPSFDSDEKASDGVGSGRATPVPDDEKVADADKRNITPIVEPNGVARFDATPPKTKDVTKDDDEMSRHKIEKEHSLSSRKRSKKSQPQEDVNADQLDSASTRKTTKPSTNSEEKPRTKAKPAEHQPKEEQVESDDTSIVRSNRKPIVMFTGIASDDLLKIVSDLGGSITDRLGEADILVCDSKVRRTVKFMCGLATAEAIVTDEWLLDSEKSGTFIETDRYVLVDKAAERQFGFRLADSLQAENRRILLRGKLFWIAPECNPKPADFTPIIECSGGSVVDQDPSTLSKDVFIISMPGLEDQNRELTSLGLNVYDKELVLTSILRQSFETDEFKIDFEPSPPKSKRRRR